MLKCSFYSGVNNIILIVLKLKYSTFKKFIIFKKNEIYI